MGETLTYLHMTGPDELRPAPDVEDVELTPLPRTSALIRTTTERIGRPHAWPSLGWSDQQWDAYTAGPARRFWALRHAGEAAGLADAELQAGGDVEITTFGLVPEAVGRGIGAFALTLAVRAAWALPGTSRVWLHTSDLDHPHALPNYLARGFRRFRTERGPGRLG